MGCSRGKISLFPVQDLEVGDGAHCLLVRKVAMTMGLGSTLTSVMADGRAWHAQAIVQVGMVWSGNLGGQGHPLVDDSKPELHANRESQVPRLARPCSRPFKMTGRWMGKLHGTTESQVMILKLFPSLLLRHSSQMLQDRITLAFQVLQALISPKIVFWPLTMPSLSQLPLGIPVAPGIRWVPFVFICQ